MDIRKLYVFLGVGLAFAVMYVAYCALLTDLDVEVQDPIPHKSQEYEIE